MAAECAQEGRREESEVILNGAVTQGLREREEIM